MSPTTFEDATNLVFVILSCYVALISRMGYSSITGMSTTVKGEVSLSKP